MSKIVCLYCKKEISPSKFKPRKFCSSWPCYQTWWRRNIKGTVDKHSEAFSQKMKKINRTYITGKNNHNWKGGVTSEYEKIRKSTIYKEWRKAVFERDNYTCIWCGQRGGNLNADRIKPFAFFPKLRFSIKNGRTLCEKCHRTTFIFTSKNYLKNKKLCHK